VTAAVANVLVVAVDVDKVVVVELFVLVGMVPKALAVESVCAVLEVEAVVIAFVKVTDVASVTSVVGVGVKVTMGETTRNVDEVDLSVVEVRTSLAVVEVSVATVLCEQRLLLMRDNAIGL
jgi:hypothetical protein